MIASASYCQTDTICIKPKQLVSLLQTRDSFAVAKEEIAALTEQVAVKEARLKQKDSTIQVQNNRARFQTEMSLSLSRENSAWKTKYDAAETKITGLGKREKRIVFGFGGMCLILAGLLIAK